MNLIHADSSVSWPSRGLAAQVDAQLLLEMGHNGSSDPYFLLSYNRRSAQLVSG